MADEIGLKAWEFGENLKDGYQKVDVRKNDKEPLKLAEEYAEKSTRLNPEDAKLILDHVKQVKPNFKFKTSPLQGPPYLLDNTFESLGANF